MKHSFRGRFLYERDSGSQNVESMLDSFAKLLLTSRPSTIHPSARLVSASHRQGLGLSRDRSMFMQVVEEKAKDDVWQTRLDKALLSIDLEPQERLRLLQESLTDPALQEDIGSAFGSIQTKGREGAPDAIEKLWPKGTIARSDLDGLAALQKQVPELLGNLEKQIQSPPSIPSSPSLPDPVAAFNSLLSFATDSKKQSEVLEEVQDAFRSTPKGLETPKYEVVRTIETNTESIELRMYEEFTVASTRVNSGSISNSGASGFNTLASYLFGGNEEKRGMKMTMPVEMSSSDSEESMSFVLPKDDSDSPPTPLSSSDVSISKIPARLVAVKAFPGIVTDGEVERQKLALLEALADDELVEPIDEKISVLQYNSPFTIPWRRRNEVAIVVRTKTLSEETVEAADEPAEVQSEILAADGPEQTVGLADDSEA